MWFFLKECLRKFWYAKINLNVFEEKRSRKFSRYQNRYVEEFLFLLKEKYLLISWFCVDNFACLFPCPYWNYMQYFSQNLMRNFPYFLKTFKKCLLHFFYFLKNFCLEFRKILSKFWYNFLWIFAKFSPFFTKMSPSFHKIFSNFFIISTKHFQNVC